MRGLDKVCGPARTAGVGLWGGRLRSCGDGVDVDREDGEAGPPPVAKDDKEGGWGCGGGVGAICLILGVRKGEMRDMLTR